MTDIEPREEIWVFAGNRVGSKGNRVHAWASIDDAENELWFPARGSYTPGSTYRVVVTRYENGNVTKHDKPVYLGRHDDSDLRMKLEASHRAAETRLRVVALERNDKRHSALDEAIEPLAALLRSAPPIDRDAILVYIIRRLARAW